MKNFLFAACTCMLLFSAVRAQNVANTYWLAYDSTNSPGLYWHFDSDTCWYSVNGSDYDSVSTFTENTSQFFITDIYYPGPNYCSSVGTYNKVFSADTMWLIPVTDSCIDRWDYFDTHFFISIPASISEISASASFTLAPNPNNGVFTIGAQKPVSSVTICNIWGEIILQQKFTGSRIIELSNASSGIYLVTIQFADGTAATQKISVQ